LGDDDGLYRKYWEGGEAVHFVGKDINRFHSIFWPIFLMAQGLPLPNTVYAHGWFLSDGQKIGKSLGNGVYPEPLAEKYGTDAIRYYLLRCKSFGGDGDFTEAALVSKVNSELANDFGNLLSRTVGMIDKYFGGVLPAEHEGNVFDAEVINAAKTAAENVEIHMDGIRFPEALSEIWALIRRANKYVDETAPWVLAKDPQKRGLLAGVMYTLAESLRIVSILILPFMPRTPAKVWVQLSIEEGELTAWESAKEFGKMGKEVRVSKGEIIFPRIEVVSAPIVEEARANEITIDEFQKVELKVGEILSCEPVKGSDKLLCSQVKVGGEIRQIVSGIAKYYSPGEMTGKKVIIVTNLKAVKLRGVMSQGMLLCAENSDGTLKLVTVEEGALSGAVVS
jgi:methionyl-tRNA synthetase